MKAAGAVLSQRSVGGIVLSITLLVSLPVLAETFSSGSTGVDGAFEPTGSITVPLPEDGVFNYTSVTIPSGVTVTYQRNAANTPVTILATGDVDIAGIIDVSGAQGAAPSSSGPVINPGAVGGPGGFDGGSGGARGGGTGDGPGQGLAGGSPSGISFTQISGQYGASSAFVSLLPLFGGSGGAGGPAFTETNTPNSGGSGGGGGGSIVIASSTKITVNGSVLATGGDNRRSPFSSGAFSCDEFSISPGAGSGGAIRLVAPEVLGTGSLSAKGGMVCRRTSGSNPDGFAGTGRIRIESLALGFTGTADPGPSFSPVLNPVSPTGSPALVNLPTITITAVGGAATPATPTGAFGTPDVILPAGTTNPIQVNLAAAHIPLGRTLTVRLTRQFADATSFTSTPLNGAFEASTATADVNFPPGEVSLVLVFATFTLPQLASLFPWLDGEPVDHILVAAGSDGTSSLTLVTSSGNTARLAALPAMARRQVARAFQLASVWRDGLRSQGTGEAPTLIPRGAFIGP